MGISSDLHLKQRSPLLDGLTERLVTALSITGMMTSAQICKLERIGLRKTKCFCFIFCLFNRELCLYLLIFLPQALEITIKSTV